MTPCRCTAAACSLSIPSLPGGALNGTRQAPQSGSSWSADQPDAEPSALGGRCDTPLTRDQSDDACEASIVECAQQLLADVAPARRRHGAGRRPERKVWRERQERKRLENSRGKLGRVKWPYGLGPSFRLHGGLHRLVRRVDTGA